jgi:hypothetical protein
MEAFSQALPSPLDERERRLFGALYFKSPHLGGLPLVLLRDRFGFLREAILDVFDAPGEPGPLGVLLRLLQFYEEMASERRAVDRGLKRREIHNRATGRVARIEVLDEEKSDEPAPGSGGLFLRIAVRLCSDRGVRCGCRNTGSWTAGLLQHGAGRNMLPIDVECEVCGHSESLRVGREKFEEIGWGLTDPWLRRYRADPGTSSDG